MTSLTERELEAIRKRYRLPKKWDLEHLDRYAKYYGLSPPEEKKSGKQG